MATTTTRKVPKAEWQKFFDDFGKRREGWRVLIEVNAKDLGDQSEVRNAPLLGINYITAGTGAGNVEIGFGDRPDRYAGHTIDQPRRTFVASTDGGAEDDVEFESADGTKTIIRMWRDGAFASAD